MTSSWDNRRSLMHMLERLFNRLQRETVQSMHAMVDAGWPQTHNPVERLAFWTALAQKTKAFVARQQDMLQRRRALLQHETDPTQITRLQQYIAAISEAIQVNMASIPEALQQAAIAEQLTFGYTYQLGGWNQ